MIRQSNGYSSNSTSDRNITSPTHHYVRTSFASLFGFLAVGFIFLGLVVVWLNHTLTNTDAFVSTLAPLAAKADIQTFIAQKAISSLLDSAPTEDLSLALFGPEMTLGKNSDQLKSQLQPAIETQVQEIVRSPQFLSLWTNGLRSAHSQLLQQLNDGAPVLTLDLHTVIMGVINQLAASKLSMVSDKIQLNADSGTLRIQANKATVVRQVYKGLEVGTWLLLVLVVVMTVLCVLISVHHLKTLRRVLIASGIGALLLALGLHIATSFKPKSVDAVEQQAAITVATTVVHGLLMASLIFAFACIVIAIGTKLYPVFLKSATRS